MGLRVLAGTAAVLGGGAWLANAVVDEEAIGWAGLGLFAVALVATGAGLVSSSAGWLRLLVALALPLLVWSVLTVVRDGVEDATVDLAVGITAVLLGVLTLISAARSRSRRPRGRH